MPRPQRSNEWGGSTRKSAVLMGLALLGFGGATFAADGWEHYGASLAGDRYHAPSGVTPESVSGLVPAWTYRTGDAAGISRKARAAETTCSPSAWTRETRNGDPLTT